MSNKHTIEFVKEKFEKEGWVCTSEEYINAKSKLNYICPKGHVGTITWDSWNHGHRCSECVKVKKPMISFIRSKFEEEGWILFSNEYINSSTKLDCICSKGHHGSITWNSWQRGRRCSKCAGNKKLTIEFVRSEFEKKGWVLTSKKYINSSSKLDYICPKGHSGTITWYNWQRGGGCVVCADLKKPTIGSIRSEFEEDNYNLTSIVYVNAQQKLDYICPEGHHGSIRWVDWQRGVRCLTCSGNEKHTIKFIKSEFEKEKWKLLSEEYINAHQKLDYICSEGHHGSIRWNDWQQGCRCSACSGIKKLTIEFVKSEFEKEGWVCSSSEYINNSTHLDYICPKGHHGTITWDNWKRGRRCPKCSMNSTSIWESTIKEFVKLLGVPFLENDRTLIRNTATNRYVELDLWFPDLNKAIECNSKYWHKNRKHIDLLKQEWCKDNNVSLLVVTDIEWNEDIKKCQTKIKKFLN